MTIGTVLYQLRVKFDESQEQVADATDISRVAYSRYENDQREPKASCAIRLAQHFGVTVEYLYGMESNASVSPQSPEEMEMLKVFHSLSKERRAEVLQFADFSLSRQEAEKGHTASAG